MADFAVVLPPVGEWHANPLFTNRRWRLWFRLSAGNGCSWYVDQVAERSARWFVGCGLHLPHPHQPTVEREVYRLCGVTWSVHCWWQDHCVLVDGSGDQPLVFIHLLSFFFPKKTQRQLDRKHATRRCTMEWVWRHVLSLPLWLIAVWPCTKSCDSWSWDWEAAGMVGQDLQDFFRRWF